MKAREITYTAICVALMAVCSWITIPFTVPFTLQTFAVFFAANLLGVKKALIAVAVYIILGALGLPVFSGFAGGIGVLLGNTGGYITGFLAMVPVCCLARRQKKLVMRFLVMLASLVVLYTLGTAWFMVAYAKNTGAIALATVLGWCVVPFIVPDIAKMVLAMLISDRLRSHLHL